MKKALGVVSVIIPTKDRLTHLKRMLPHYLAQPEVGEVVVVIDGSTDGTHEYLRALHRTEPRVCYLNNGVNRGIPFSKNRGISAARCPYIFIGEDDLEITDNFFGVLLDHLHKTGADVICGRNIFRRESETAAQAISRTNRMRGQVINPKTIEINTSMRLPDDRFQTMIAAPALARTEVFKKVGFDERYKVNFWREETDFQLGAQKAGYALASCPHAMCFNYIIDNDRGGVHAAAGLRRIKWVVINNWHFINKHQDFIAEHFSIGNKHVYIVKFAMVKLFTETMLPVLSAVKRALLARLHR
jgi:GT2 family glycosyltransferase